MKAKPTAAAFVAMLVSTAAAVTLSAGAVATARHSCQATECLHGREQVLHQNPGGD